MCMLRLFLINIILLLSCVCPAVEAAVLEQIAVDNEALLCTLRGPAQYKTFTLHNPERVVIDLANTKMLFVAPRLLNRLIKRVRTGQQGNILRLVLDVTQSVTVQANMRPTTLGFYALHIQLATKKASKSSNTLAKTLPIQPKAVRVLRDVVVVLDPGHGGKDPGAIGPLRHAEKEVVLAIAQKLKAVIDKQPGMRAVLTRKGDYYIGLRQRMAIARQYNADAFISIHADAFIHQRSHGASVFALSQMGATSEAARWLAEKENHSELGGVNLSDLKDDNGLIRTVLLDLSQTATIGASLQIGSQVLQNMSRITRLHNHKVEQARFVVLKSPDIPSILIETGFISNPLEERNLSNPSWQTQITQAIFQGLLHYFKHYPPHDTRFEVLADHQ